MPKINKLDPSVYNLISAGEVVENPASVVKELVENAIDAGATEITISIVNGGIKQIKIIDNGCGMDKENIYLSYLPHATSKVSKASDLDSISTLGFRGEALASIAAVSHLTVSSCPDEQQGVGYYVKVSNGKIEDENEVGMNSGTIICVDDLFYNTPVRLKFLKSAKQEESLVKSKVIQLIFANSDLKFKFIVDNEVVLQTSGGLEDAIYAIYGNDIANGLISFDYSQNSGYRAYGYTSNREIYKHNKSFQTIIVNGRPIVNQNIMTAVIQAYGSSLMKRTYPIYILNLIIPFDEVDVNVHPTKAEVRFQDNHKIFSLVYRAILSAIDNQMQNLELSNGENLNKTSEKDEQEKRTDVQSKSKQIFTNDKIPGIIYETSPNLDVFLDKNENSNIKDTSNDDISNLLNSQFMSIDENLKNYKLIKDIENAKNNNSNLDNDGISDNIIYSNLENSRNMANENNSYLDKIDNNLTQYTVLGQLFETFLVIQDGSNAYLIDQHACHEKFLYEKLINKVNQKNSGTQLLLIPYILTCNSNQYDYMNALMDNLKDLGFDIEEFGDLTFKVNAIPEFIVDINLTKFFEDILCEKSIIQNLKSSDLIKDKLAQYACKAAVKAGDKLSEAQVRELFRQMKNGIPMQCPHGRPCIFKFTRTDLDKLFKRIE